MNMPHYGITITANSVTERDKYFAMLATTITFFPGLLLELFELFGFRGDVFFKLLSGVLVTTSKPLITSFSFWSLEIKPSPSVTKDLSKQSLISPTETDSTAPCKFSTVTSR